MEKKKLESYLRQLQELDSELTENSDPDELMNEINKVINCLSKDIQVEISSATLKFVNKSSNNPDPEFACEGDSGFDIRANLEEDVIINEGQVKIIPTGLYFEVDKGLEVQIRTGNEMVANNNLWVLNSPGTIDSSYRGEIMIILANFNDSSRTIRNGDRIAQAVVCPVYGEGKLNMIKVKKLSETTRNDSGFESSGID
jgi:dUTP pyrophosphatase